MDGRLAGKIINPILRGCVNYFAMGNSARHFAYVREWVEKKIRRHLMRAIKRIGLGKIRKGPKDPKGRTRKFIEIKELWYNDFDFGETVIIQKIKESKQEA